MKIRNVHSRDLPVPAECVGALLDGLGGPTDQLFPCDRWPTGRLELDGPLAEGITGRQGAFELTQMRQRVDEYVPGRRLVFRFSPGLGVIGTHCFDVQSLGAERARLTHTLDCRVKPSMLPVLPIFIRQHDALIEDLLDRAELLTTGRIANPARWPVSVRLANAVELSIARRRGILPGYERTTSERPARVCGLVVPAVLASIAALHAAWALGWYWPAGSERELAELVLSSGERERLDGDLPPSAITWLVALGLAGAAAVVRSAARGSRSRAVRRVAWGVAATLLVRGVVYPPLDILGGLENPYDRLDLAIYSPLCLTLAAATAIVLRRTRQPLPIVVLGPDAGSPRTPSSITERFTERP